MDKREVLYKNLLGSGRIGIPELGTLGQFRTAVKDEPAARRLYQNLKGSGRLSESEIGTEDQFYGSISSDFGQELSDRMVPSASGKPESSPSLSGGKGGAGVAGPVSDLAPWVPPATAPFMPPGSSFYRDRSPAPLREFIPGVKQGVERVYQNNKNAVGEAAGFWIGSQRDYQRALGQLDEMLAAGYALGDYDKEKARDDYKYRNYQREREQYREEKTAWDEKFSDLSGWDKVRHFSDYPFPPSEPDPNDIVWNPGDEMELLRAFTHIGEALKESGGDLEKTRAILTRGAQEERWGDKVSREAREARRAFRETEGWATVGEFAPQVAAGTAAAAASILPVTRPFARPLAAANIGVMASSARGEQMAEARDYGASTKEVSQAGNLAAGVEVGSSLIPYDKVLKGVGKGLRNRIGKKMVSRIMDKPVAPGEVTDFFRTAGKKQLPKLFSRENADAFAGDVLKEAADGFVSGSAEAMIPMLYLRPEDYPAFREVVGEGVEGLKAGLISGSFVGATNRFANYYEARSRRKEQRVVPLAQIGNDIVEVLGRIGDNYSVMNSDGKVSEVSPDRIADHALVDFSQLDGFARLRTEEKLMEAVRAGQQLDFGESLNIFRGVAAQAGISDIAPLMEVTDVHTYLSGHPGQAAQFEAFFAARARLIGSASLMFEPQRNRKTGDIVTAFDRRGREVFVVDETDRGCLVSYADNSREYLPFGELKEVSACSIGEYTQQFLSGFDILHPPVSGAPAVPAGGEVDGGGVSGRESGKVVPSGAAVPEPGGSQPATRSALSAAPRGAAGEEKALPLTKAGKPDYNAMLAADPELFATEWEKRSSPGDTRHALGRQSDRIGRNITALQDRLDAEQDFNRIVDLEEEILALTQQKEAIDAVMARRYANPGIRAEQDPGSKEHETRSGSRRQQPWNESQALRLLRNRRNLANPPHNLFTPPRK